jgi:hypothetical protein
MTVRRADALLHALDEARFGTARILNLRASFPTAADATARADAWLREQQVAHAGAVLVITGRGAGSENGVAVVREAILRLLASLRRKGVVHAVQEHTPGSFVVELAPMRALLEAPRRKRERGMRVPPDPRELQGLDAETRRLLRELAERTLLSLGVHARPAALVQDEMLRRFTTLAASTPPGPEREQRLRVALRSAIAEYDERE